MSRPVRNDYYNADHWGLVGDGATDDLPALQKCVDDVEALGGGTITVGWPSQDYLLDGQLTLGRNAPVRLKGIGSGIRGVTKLEFAHTNGVAIRLMSRSCAVESFMIDSTPARQVSGDLAGDAILVQSDTVTGPSQASRIELKDLQIQRHPGNGVHAVGGIELSKFDNVTVADCGGHGYRFGDGSHFGFTNTSPAPFVVELDRCRAIECGGQGLLVGTDGVTDEPGRSRLFRLNHFESLGCAYGPASVDDYQIVLVGEQFSFEQLDVEDQQWADTVTASTGSARVARAAPTKGVRVAYHDHEFRQPYFSSLTNSITMTAGRGLRITQPRVFGTNQIVAFDVPAGTLGYYFAGGAANINATTVTTVPTGTSEVWVW